MTDPICPSCGRTHEREYLCNTLGMAGDDTPQWTRSLPTERGWYWFKWPDQREPSCAVVMLNNFSVWVTGIYELLHEDDVEGCLWAGPITPPPLPEAPL